jgi:hypothetical protein
MNSFKDRCNLYEYYFDQSHISYYGSDWFGKLLDKKYNIKKLLTGSRRSLLASN